jgi:uncharacterized protein with ParB-like and HNH nuclease domain
MGFEVPITIEKVIREIQANKYILPAIQREFVWSSEQIEKLFDSLMRGYPIGSFLFWKVQPDRVTDFQFYRFMDHYHERDFKHNDVINLINGQEVTAALDGQQRLTALNIGLKGWYAYKLPYYSRQNEKAFPKRELYLNLKGNQDEFDFAYEFKFLKETEIQESEGKYWFKVGDILKFPDIQSVVYYCIEHGLTQGNDKFSTNAMMELWRVIKEKQLINYFLEEDQDLDKVLNIFIRVNSGGTPLSYSDMLLSIATAAWQDRDARQDIYELVDRLNHSGEGFAFDKDFILKASLVLTDIPAIEFRVTNFKRDNMLQIEEDWDEIQNALTAMTHLLVKWGYSSQTLPSYYATIPLAYYLYKTGAPSNFITIGQYENDRNNMLYWLRIALLKRTFSGTPDSVLRTIRKAMQTAIQDEKSFPGNAIFDELKTTSRTMKFDAAELDGLMSYRYGQIYTFSILALLYPWLKFDQLFNVDHVFPRGMFNAKELQKRNIPKERWSEWLDHFNDIGNLQLLPGSENIIKSDQEFEKWLENECPKPADLIAYRELHLIPDVDLSFEQFPEFLAARSKVMRSKLAEILNIKLPDNENGQNDLGEK